VEKVVNHVRFLKLLEDTDHELAEAVRRDGCLECGAPLDVANFSRKPRGGPTDWDKRLSFCCRRCRARHTPASVRFLGPKVYVGVMVTLVAAMLHGLSSWRVACLSRELGVDRRTLKRWREWWQAAFIRSRFWKGARAAFARPVAEPTMPVGLLAAFGGTDGAQAIVRLLKFLSPITVGKRGGGIGM
jgi:hypothetical protein